MKLRCTAVLLAAAACSAHQGTPGDPGDPGDPGTDASQSGDDPNHPATPCESIAPSTDPAQNRATITGCLDSDHEAFLTGGTYPIDDGFNIPDGATLKGLSDPAPTIILQPGGHTNVVVGMNANTTLRHLRIDGNAAIGFLANASTVGISGPGATVDEVEIFNHQQPPFGYHAAGVYFIGGQTHDNVVKASKIYNHFYGVIFRSGYVHGTNNRITGSEVRNTNCDAITFGSYGESVGNTVHDTGFDCENGPIPGAAYYSLDNPEGALIKDDTAYDTCGNVIDMDNVSQLTITGGTFRNPGAQFGGFAPYCGGARTAMLLGVSNSTFSHNTFENTDRSQNAGFDPNQTMHANGAGAFTDVSGGVRAAIAVELARRPTGTSVAVGNHFDSNVFRATLSGGFIGVGLFTSRGTGYDVFNGWSAATTNYFTGNVTVGSNVGSMRCGGDWFAGNSACAAGSPSPCNDDDFQHSSSFHTDGCSFY